MTRERWPEIERIVSAALERQPDAQHAFVAEACGADEALRHEVESLLARDVEARHFLETPAATVVAALSAEGSLVGRRFGPYTMLSLLGAGGMGEVYRARDEQLDRDVAIKVLPPVFATDADRRARFEREARILASLNHPHVGAIYGLADIDGVPALILEIVEGPTLAERISEAPFSVEQALTVAIQITEALEAAHARGIVHRDLKPANIKIAQRSAEQDVGHAFAKLLDFGLAKAIGDCPPERTAQVIAAPTSSSTPGAVLGTAAYMSPEQARGEPADARSDLFSLGAVLYELLTGRAAFGGATRRLILDAILSKNPTPPHVLNSAVPPALDRVVMRLLTKDRVVRYQSAAGVRQDLQQIARDLRHRTDATLRRAVMASIALAIGTAATAWVMTRRMPPALAPQPEYTQVTHFADSATSPALSADGRTLAFLRGDSTFLARGQIYVKRLPDGEPVALTNDAITKMSPAFSPDGQQIAYTTLTPTFAWETWTVPVTGGEPTRLLENASGLSWLKDGRMLFSELVRGLHMRVVSSDVHRGHFRSVYSPASERGMAHRSAVSPDGAWMLVAEMESPVWQPCRLVPMNGESSGRRVGPDGACTSAAWSPDGAWMYFSSNSGGSFHIWRQHFPDGGPEQITYGATEEEGIAPDPDGRSFLTSVGTRHSSIRVRDARGEREVSREGYAFVPQLPNSSLTQPFSADGRLLFYLVRQGAVRFTGVGERAGELWTTDLTTHASRSLLPGRRVIGYDVSRNGYQVAFAALDDSGDSHIWLMRLAGNEPPRQLASFVCDSPRFGPDGEVFCRHTEAGLSFIYRLREGRAPEKALNRPALFLMSVSPDANWVIALIRIGAPPAAHNATFAFPINGGEPILLCDACDIDWTPDGASLVLRLQADMPSSGRTTVIALEPGASLPAWPPEGVRTPADLRSFRILEAVDGIAHPGHDHGVFAIANATTDRNVFRVRLP